MMESRAFLFKRGTCKLLVLFGVIVLCCGAAISSNAESEPTVHHFAGMKLRIVMRRTTQFEHIDYQVNDEQQLLGTFQLFDSNEVIGPTLAGLGRVTGKNQIIPRYGGRVECENRSTADSTDVQIIGHFDAAGFVIGVMPSPQRSLVNVKCHPPGQPMITRPSESPNSPRLTTSKVLPWRFNTESTDIVESGPDSRSKLQVTLTSACRITATAQSVPVTSSGAYTVEPDVNNALGARQVERLTRKHQAETVLWGLTQSVFDRPDIGYTLHLRPSDIGEGVCISGDEYRLALNARGTVYLAHELLPGTCPYRATLLHEHRHIRSGADLARTYAERIAQAMVDAGLAIPSQEIWGASKEEAEHELDRRISQVVKPLLNDYFTALVEADRSIDSADDTTGACSRDDWTRVETRYNMGGRP